MESAIFTFLQSVPEFYYPIVKLVIQTWGLCMYVCMKHPTVCRALQVFCFFRHMPPRRDGMSESPPSYCFSPADDGPNNFIARAIKLRVLAMKTREKCK